MTLFLIQSTASESECQSVDKLLLSTHLARQRNLNTVLLSVFDQGDKPSPGQTRDLGTGVVMVSSDLSHLLLQPPTPSSSHLTTCIWLSQVALMHGGRKRNRFTNAGRGEERKEEGMNGEAGRRKGRVESSARGRGAGRAGRALIEVTQK